MFAPFEHFIIKYLVHFAHVVAVGYAFANRCDVPQVTIGFRQYLDNTKLKANAICNSISTSKAHFASFHRFDETFSVQIHTRKLRDGNK